jgi:NarL family two-component system response regulator LiaR
VTPEPDALTVLIVDDHELVRQGVRAFLDAQADLHVVGEASSGKEALLLARELVPDVVLMDLLMPGLDGVEATRRLKETSPRSQVVVLTSHHDDAHVFPALRAGALSYVLKSIGPEELAGTVRRAAHGEPTLHPRVALRLMRDVRGEEGGPDASAELTPREMEVLKLIAEGLANADIAERLGVAEKTVKGHVSNVLSKLHLADRTQAAVYAWREGVVRRDEDAS